MQDISNIGQALNFAKNLLAEKNIKDADLSAEILLAEVCSLNRQQLYSHFGDKLNSKQQDKLSQYIKRRLDNEPIQYILGYSYFRGLKLQVNNKVLIPRPETEFLVNCAINSINKTNSKVLDLCTGSGCIACSIANELIGSQIIAVDNSDEALKCAEDNAKRHNLEQNIKFINADITDGLDLEDNFDCVITNPPYIPCNVYNQLDAEVIEYEPKPALIAGADGLDYYPYVFDIALNSLCEGGILVLEMHEDQAQSLMNMALDKGFNNLKISKDLAGKDRVLTANLSS